MSKSFCRYLCTDKYFFLATENAHNAPHCMIMVYVQSLSQLTVTVCLEVSVAIEWRRSYHMNASLAESF